MSEDIFNQACRDLPEGWEIVIELEQGAGVVRLEDPWCQDIELCFDDMAMEQMIRSAIDYAMQHQSEVKHVLGPDADDEGEE